MSLRRVPDSEVSQLLGGDSRSVLIVAPNFETRSTRVLSCLPDPTGWIDHTIAIQVNSSNPVEPLEWLRREQLESVDVLEPTKIQFNYPRAIAHLRRRLVKELNRLPSPARVLFDISSLPRRVIFECFRSFGSTTVEIESVLLLYAWAGSYPQLPHSSSGGGLTGLREGQGLHDLIEQKSKPAALVIPGRQAFASSQLVDAFAARASRVTLAALYDRDDPLSSLESLRANAPLFHELQTEPHYSLTLEEAYGFVGEWVSEMLQDGSDLLLIAPFGPKPILVWSYLQLNHQKIDWDIVLLRESGRLTTYSVGVGRLEVFEITGDELQA